VEAGDGKRAGSEMAAHLVRLRETYRVYETAEEALATQAAD
jgi:hypothetical protein